MEFRKPPALQALVDLRDELRRVAERTLQQVFKQAGNWDEGKYPNLARIVQNIVGDQLWQSRPNQSLIDVMCDAIRDLPEKLAQRGAEDKATKTRIPEDYVGSPERKLAGLLYGFQYNDAKSAPYAGKRSEADTYDRHYRRAALDLLGAKDRGSTAGRVFRAIWEDLADKLLDMEHEALEDRERQSELPVSLVDAELAAVSPLVPRGNQVDRVLEQIKAGNTTVCIWGEPGTGKSTVAYLVARAIKLFPVAVLHAGDPELLRDEITDLLIAEGLEPTNWSDTYSRSMLRQKFGRQSETRPIHRILIIDNVDDENLIPQLVPDRPGVGIFITMRTRPQHPSLARVELGDFTEPEACHFIASNLSGSDDTEVLALARLLGCRPLALDHAVRFVRDADDVALGDVITTLAMSVTDGLNVITDPTEKRRNLVLLYKMILSSIVSEGFVGQVLDTFLAVTGKSGIFGNERLFVFMGSEFWRSQDRVHVRSGLRALSSKGLVREIRLTIPGRAARTSDSTRHILMHPLTYEILRDLRSAVVFRIENDYLGFLSSPQVADAIQRSVDGVARLTSGLASAFLVHYESSLMELPSGYDHFHCIDEYTWVAVLSSGDKDDPAYIVRYEVYPHGVYKLDYRDGKRMPIEYHEAVQFASLVQQYQERVLPKLAEFMAIGDDQTTDTQD